MNVPSLGFPVPRFPPTQAKPGLEWATAPSLKVEVRGCPTQRDVRCVGNCKDSSLSYSDVGSAVLYVRLQPKKFERPPAIVIFFRYCVSVRDSFTFRVLIRSCGPWGSKRIAFSAFVPDRRSQANSDFDLGTDERVCLGGVVNRRMPVSKNLICAILTSLVSLTASAQQITGSIRGTVVDPVGASVQGASISAIQVETGLTRSAMTNRSGEYVLLELPVGHYRLQATAKGFQSYIQLGIVLDVNETATVPVRLLVGSETQKIEVQSDAQLIQATVTSLGKTVSERDVLELPLNGRNFSQLGLLQPGVAPLTPGLAEAGGSLRDGQAYAVNGQRPESNNFLIDGANNFNGVAGGFVLKPPIDAITEFRILTHNANAEFGTSLGSTTNIITRSGSNNFHGALWEFLRNDAFDATNYFATRTEPLKQNQFGGTFGGPVIKDKTFFFGYYEGFRNRQGETDSSTVPSLAERQGFFGGMPGRVLGRFLQQSQPPTVQCFSQPAVSEQSVRHVFSPDDHTESAGLFPGAQ